MKKNYVKPEIQVIELDTESLLLIMSGYDDVTGPVGAPSRHRYEVWDLEEEDVF